MQKDSAQKLIQETLQSSFNKERFIYLTKNVLNHIEEAPFTYKGNLVFDDFADSIQSVERLGKYQDPEEKLIDVLIVRLKKEASLDRARTKQRNFVAKYLKGSRGGVLKDAALVAFVSPNEDDWRFSLVKMEYKFNEKGKVEEEFTPARRYSFLVGKHENSHTAQSRLLPLLLNDEVNPTLKELEDVFSVEKVTKEFFEKYRELFLKLKESLDEIIKKDKKVKEDFKAKDVNTIDFTKKLLGQIVFLYFLQKKGWFGVERNKEWDSGSKRFLRELFEKKHGNYKNFFNEILEPLFYEALRLERTGDYYSRFDCRIPFLNGGLFDPLNDYDWVDTEIELPNEIFSNEIKDAKTGDVGTGILDVFDRYNFTVKEDEPLEKEVAVDPEMLGKVFENLLEVKDRKSKGTYYTPREIVHYMCQESLANYLATELEGKATKEDIETLIKYGESVVEHDSRVVSEGRETGRYSFKLSQSVRKHAKEIDDKLASIRVCDPAVGSGAFPVGMMNEVIRTRNALTAYIGKTGDRTPYNFKRHAIQNCLYGVDIDPGAVEIAKLRLWLSLIVDEEDIKQIKPLPNLDYKIMQGNSLLGVQKERGGMKDMFYEHSMAELEKIIRLHLNEANANKKRGYKENIDELIDKITRGRKQFDFEVYFSEVFREKGGFDVVIANPPYVRADSPDFKGQREAIMKSAQYETLYERWDLFVPFIERGLKLSGKHGFLCYITSNSLLTSKFAFKILEYIQTYYAVQFIDYFDDAWVFEAGVVPVVFGIAREAVLPTVRKQTHIGSFENISKKDEVPLSEFKKLGKDAFRQTPVSFINVHIPIVQLGNICYLSYGLRPNSDERYWRGEFTRDDLVSNTKDKKHPKSYIEGKNLDRYRIDKILYLEWGTDRIPKKLVRQTFPELYEKPKLLKGTMTGGTYDEAGIFCNHSIVVFVRFIDLSGVKNKSISGSLKKFNSLPRADLEKVSTKFDLKYLLAILNSKFANNFLNGIRRHRLENYFYPDDYRKLPIADISIKDQKPFSDLVNKILAITKDNDYLENSAKQAKVRDYEKQIDQLVYKLYGLTPEEIKIVEENPK